MHQSIFDIVRRIFAPAAFVLPALLLLAGGCQSAKVLGQVPKEMLGNEPDQQLSFWHTLAGRNLASNEEAFHGLLLYVDNKDDSADYDARVSLLKSRKMLPADFNEPFDQAVTRGTMAVAICHILNIRGGAMLHMFPTSPRYAVRELEFVDLYPPSSPHQTFSGAEFVGVIGRVEDYERGNPADRPAAVLPSEMNAPPRAGN